MLAAAASLHRARGGAKRLWRLAGMRERCRTQEAAREHALAEQWIPRHIGKGPGQPPQLACTGRLARLSKSSGSRDSVGTEH